MTRTQHVITIINDICVEANLTVLDQYVESDQVLIDKSAYSFIINESEESFYEDNLAFQMTSVILCYIDFRLDDFADNFTDKKNEILQSIEDARITANLTLMEGIDNFYLTSSVPKIVSVAGTFDTNNRKGILDIIFEIKTLASPK
jgi:hypothetical protein